ncbi:membrane-bound lytic murein transglycosylase MltF [Shewanella algae]|uniref:membrane-bound lytic murein transglycosylase MltF n=1 Tax=Shewanella TaxID=22 RepID=UPI0014306FB2|nr:MULTISPECIES: membrane-bound lytic murein transglycosylase MltF [Shewanella]MBO2594726.1 membrane-bound lytic murein transglycosylase MltF [Shewanella algae]MBO2666082.1 membrane-bound lytic murein transglycosylase MltF [Shewanella algae]NJI83241.1 membrane-bound lytic murein transglycosylase MltF [Shewanella sp. Iso12]
MKRFTATLTLIILLAGCRQAVVDETQVIPAVNEAKELRVGTLYGPQIYVSSTQGSAGFDYEMAARFADFLGKPLEMKPYGNINELYQALKQNEIDLIAAGLSDTRSRRQQFRLGPPLYRVNQVMVYRAGTPVPKDLNALDAPVTVIADSSFVETLNRLKADNPNLEWQQVADKDNEELLSMIASGELSYTISDSTSININRRFMPELRSGQVLEQQQAVVWLLPPRGSDQLMSQLLRFWHQEQRDGTLEHLVEKYFGHVKRFDYVDTRAFIRAVDSKLPKYRHLFETYAGELDWRKLAATSYQESHWNPRARSPTGVRGMMMLTLATAKQLGVENRLDPEQSIRGGARYLSDILVRLPESIPEEERMWFALASYNIGYGHVEDARKLAQAKGLNPSAWKDLKQVLPLLQKRKYYQHTRYGYARGNEAVHYVDSIRRYYDTLVWIDNQAKLEALAREQAQEEAAQREAESQAGEETELSGAQPN